MREEKRSIEVVFQIAQEELVSLLHQQEQLTARIAIIKQSLVALAHLFGDDLLRNNLIDRELLAVVLPTTTPQRKKWGTGLTFATRRVMADAKRQLTSYEVYRLLLSQFPESVQNFRTPSMRHHHRSAPPDPLW